MNFDLAFEKLNIAKENRVFFIIHLLTYSLTHLLTYLLTHLLTYSLTQETIFRYDDTNPEAESKEYIDSLREDVEWLGWKPVRTTFTSDYFDKLYELAIELIKKGTTYSLTHLLTHSLIRLFAYR